MLQEAQDGAPTGFSLVVAAQGSGNEPAVSALIVRYVEKLGAAYAERTKQLLVSDWRCFARWCDENGEAPFPAEPGTVVGYLEERSSHLRLSTLRRRLASLSHLHTAMGLTNPTQHQAVRRTLRGLARLKGGRPEQRRTALREDDVRLILEVMGSSLRECRDRAILMTARDSLARRSELARLEVIDIDFRKSTGDARVLLRRTKTDPGGRVGWLSPETCKALKSWLKRAKIKRGPVFCQVDNAGRVGTGLHPQAIARRFKAMARTAGLDASRISGHSTRIGMAVDLVADGHSLVAVQLAGGWISPSMPAHYASELLPELGAVARYHQARS